MELADYVRFAISLFLVLGIIGIAAWGARRLGLAGRLPAATGRGGRRLGVVEIAPLDPKRRLVLVRRDGVEHLLLLGSGGDVVVECGIPADRDAGAAAPPDGHAETAQ